MRHLHTCIVRSFFNLPHAVHRMLGPKCLQMNMKVWMLETMWMRKVKLDD